jgi:hypothetical protein
MEKSLWSLDGEPRPSGNPGPGETVNGHKYGPAGRERQTVATDHLADEY